MCSYVKHLEISTNGKWKTQTYRKRNDNDVILSWWKNRFGCGLWLLTAGIYRHTQSHSNATPIFPFFSAFVHTVNHTLVQPVYGVVSHILRAIFSFNKSIVQCNEKRHETLTFFLFSFCVWKKVPEKRKN